MKKKESTDLEVKVVDCSKLEERDLNKVLGKIFEEAYGTAIFCRSICLFKVLGKIFEEAYGSAEDGSTTLQKPFVLII